MFNLHNMHYLCFTDSLTHWLTDSLTRWLTQKITQSLSGLCTHCLLADVDPTNPTTYSLADLHRDSLVNWRDRYTWDNMCRLSQTLYTQLWTFGSLTYLLTYWLTTSLVLLTFNRLTWRTNSTPDWLRWHTSQTKLTHGQCCLLKSDTFVNKFFSLLKAGTATKKGSLNRQQWNHIKSDNKIKFDAFKKTFEYSSGIPMKLSIFLSFYIYI